MQELLPLILLLAFSTLFGLAALILSLIISPKAPSYNKESLYECGINISSDAKVQFNIQFFMYAILFLIFDIETVMLFPFAVVFNELKLLALVEVTIFVLLLLLGLIYAAKKNMLRSR